jgi:hypothetical protein
MNEQQLYTIARRVAGQSHNVRVGGKIEFVKDQGPVRRDVRVKGFKWTPDSLRDLAKILWASQRAHGYALAALRIFSKMSSSEFSPDGLLGGRGYIQSIKEMRGGLSTTVELLSSFTDTVHDEINGEHWASVEDEAKIEGIVSDAHDVKKNPEGFVEEEFEDEGEEEPLINPKAENPEVEDEGEVEESEEPDTQLLPDVSRRSSVNEYDRYAIAFEKMLDKARTASAKVAGGALDELPFQGGEPNIVDWDVPGTRMPKLGPADPDKIDIEDQIIEDAYCCSYPGRPCQNPMEEQELLLDARPFPLAIYPTDGDDYRLSSSVKPRSENYSWLPGSDNRKSMNWYGLGVSESDIEWMKANCEPDMPPGIEPKELEINSVSLWDGVKI